MNLDELKTYREPIYSIAQSCGIENIRVFGSVVRGEAREDSDIDLLVSVQPNVGLDFFRFGLELEDLLKHRVDVVSDKYINPHLKPFIMRDAVPL